MEEVEVGGLMSRNCENARKARARKKLEVHQLQEQVEKLKQLHARGKLEARKARELSTRMEVLKRQNLRTFMKFRCKNVKNREKWAEIVDERVTMTLPITPYRWFNGRCVFNDSRVLRGIDDVMTDNGSLAVLVESLGCGTLPWRQEMEKGHGHGVELVCEMADNDMLTSHNTAMCSFVLRTTNAVKHGARREWRCRGMLSAKFIAGSAMLVAIEHVFDVTSLMQQLQKVVGEEKEMPVVPNTTRGACQPSNEARVIMTATPPHTVVCCNQAWTKLCGYSQEDIRGQTLKAIQGPRTDAGGLAALNREIERGRAASAVLPNYKSDGSEFLNYLRVYPLVGDGRGTVTHILGVLQEQAEPGGTDPPQSEGKAPVSSGGARQQQREREASGAALPGSATLSAADAAAATAAAAAVDAKGRESSSATNPWRGRRSVDFGAPCTPDPTIMPPSSRSSASGLSSTAGARRGGEGGGRSVAGAGKGECVMSPVKQELGVEGGDLGKGAAPAAAAATGGGGGIGGMLHGGSWASATPSAGLAGLGQQSGGVDETASVAPPHQKNPGGVSGPKRRLSAAASVASTAMDLSADGNDLTGGQLGGAWPVQGDMLLSRTPLDAEAEIGSTNRGLGDAWGCGGGMPGGDLRNTSGHLSQSLSNFSSAPNGFG
ncbi:conserved unknown protein [Ectocarpus siliculosus]|uniref:PAS domain-containing protein n=1 Tax=Ectocarpus siliculosus TaxID=2880 RepID=D8LH42_ECTSI|nr:conserved unknown protein [Ectocarpus siliculosus]|eukprot:CBN74261.1 conserved unknown protein [Ectocarpus siliculosus]